MKNERGAALVEFAFASVVFFVVLFGILDFGQAIWRYNMVSDLAQEGARWAAVRGSTSLTPATGAAVRTYVQARSPSVFVTVSTFRVNAVTRACTETVVDPSTLIAGDGFCVSVQGSYGRSARLIPIPSLTLRSTAQMVIAR